MRAEILDQQSLRDATAIVVVVLGRVFYTLLVCYHSTTGAGVVSWNDAAMVVV